MKTLFPLTPHLATPVEILWNNFASICDTCLDLIPIKLSSLNLKQPWINSYIKHMSRRKHRAYNWAHSSNESWHCIRYYILKRNVNGSVVLLMINISYLEQEYRKKSYGLALKSKDKTTLVV